MADENVDVIGISLVLIQIAKAYKMFEESVGDLSEEEKAELWQKTTDRAKRARELWEQA